MPPLIAYGAGAVGGIECFADQASLGSASIGGGHALQNTQFGGDDGV